MPDTCEVVAYVRSERVVVSAREMRGLRVAAVTAGGPVYAAARTAAVTYGRHLPLEHSAAIGEAARIAAESHTVVRVVDLGRSNPVARAIRHRLLGQRALPAVVVKGACRWESLGAHAAARPGRVKA